MSRTLIAALTSIALLGQGLGMAWESSLGAASLPDQAAAAMPCHGDDAGTADTGVEKNACDCCNGGCLFACGGAPLPAPISAGATPAPDHLFPAAAVRAPLASHTLTPFRPPAA